LLQSNKKVSSGYQAFAIQPGAARQQYADLIKRVVPTACLALSDSARFERVQERVDGSATRPFRPAIRQNGGHASESKETLYSRSPSTEWDFSFGGSSLCGRGDAAVNDADRLCPIRQWQGGERNRARGEK